MTALNAAILFNNSTGSDTTASGCGPATAVTITLQTSAGSNTANASGSLSSISAGDLMYVPSFTGRKFNVIASVQPLGGTITFDDNWDDSASGVSGYVGGKRATLEGSSQLFDYNYSSGKTQEIELETDQTITTHLGDASFGSLGVTTTVRPSSGSRAKITNNNTTATYGSYIFFGGTWEVFDIDFESTATGQQPFVAGSTSNTQRVTGSFTGCTAKSQTNNFYSFAGASYPNNLHFNRCEFAYFSSTVLNNLSYEQNVCNCYFHDNASHCIGNTSNVGAQYRVTNCVFDNNYGFIYTFGPLNSFFSGCIINNTSNSLFGTAYGGSYNLFIGNIFTNNSGTVHANVVQATSRFLDNAFYNNTNIDSTFGLNFGAITLTADPFVSASTGDFNLNADAGGGATLRANNFSLNTETAVYPFRQYVSDAFGGGGGSQFHPLG